MEVESILFGDLLSTLGNSSMVEAMGCTRKTGPEMAVRFRLTHFNRPSDNRKADLIASVNSVSEASQSV